MKPSSRLLSTFWFWLVPLVGGAVFAAVGAYRTSNYSGHGFEHGHTAFLLGTLVVGVLMAIQAIGFAGAMNMIPRICQSSGLRLFVLAAIAGVCSALALLLIQRFASGIPWLGTHIAPFGSKGKSDFFWLLVYGVVIILVAMLISYVMLTIALNCRYVCPFTPEVCRNCGYSLKGLIVSRCPECSAEFDPKLLRGGQVQGLKSTWSD